MWRVEVVGGGEGASLLSISNLLVPWAGESAGADFAPSVRIWRGQEAPKTWVYPFKRGLYPDPGGGGRIALKSRVYLMWFPLDTDGRCAEFPLLSSISSVAVTTFSGDQLPGLVEEIDRILPHLTAGDAAPFACLAFIAEELVRDGHGAIEMIPL